MFVRALMIDLDGGTTRCPFVMFPNVDIARKKFPFLDFKMDNNIIIIWNSFRIIVYK